MPVRLPLLPSTPDYRFSTELGDVTFVIDIRWNGREESWYMTVSDEEEVPIMSGLKIVLGAIPGSRSADERRPDGAFVISDLSNTSTEATLDDLGERVVVSFFTSEELEAAG